MHDILSYVSAIFFVLPFGLVIWQSLRTPPKPKCHHLSSPTVWTDVGWRKHCLKCGCDMTWEDGHA
jgi:hypothetical protein